MADQDQREGIHPRALLNIVAASYTRHAIAVRPELVPHCGGLPEAVLLQQLMYWSSVEPLIDGFLRRSAEAIEMATTLSPKQQAKARENLESRGLIEAVKRGSPGTLHWRVKWQAVIDCLASSEPQAWSDEEGNQRLPSAPRIEEPKKPRLSPEDIAAQDAQWQAFYDAYPRHIGKAEGKTVFLRKLKSFSFEEIMSGLSRYPFSEEKQYIPYPATWLNKERFVIEEGDEQKGVKAPYRPKRNIV